MVILSPWSSRPLTPQPRGSKPTGARCYLVALFLVWTVPFERQAGDLDRAFLQATLGAVLTEASLGIRHVLGCHEHSPDAVEQPVALLIPRYVCAVSGHLIPPSQHRADTLSLLLSPQQSTLKSTELHVTCWK